jgi:hypothetical protein
MTFMLGFQFEKKSVHPERHSPKLSNWRAAISDWMCWFHNRSITYD